MSLIGILIVIYFCYSQFKAERPRRFIIFTTILRVIDVCHDF